VFFLRCLQDNITGLPGMSRAFAAVPGKAASQIYHETRRKLGFFERRFPAAPQGWKRFN